jgi:hypothetical protein
MLWSEDVGSEVVDLSLFLDFVNGIRWILAQGCTGTSPGQRATSTCASLLAAGLFIDSQSLIDNGALLDLAMVEARRLFRRESRRRWCLVAAAGFSKYMKPRITFMQSFQDTSFLLM